MADANKGLEAGRRIFAERGRPSGIQHESTRTAEDEPRPGGTVESGRALYEQTHPKGNR